MSVMGRGTGLFTAIAFLVLAGCTDRPPPYDPFAEATPADVSALQFDDIPVPSGFAMDLRTSWVWTDPRAPMRVGDLRYRGGTALSPERLVAFYEEQMPLAGWSLVRRELFGETFHLEFAGGGFGRRDRAVVRIAHERPDRKGPVSIGVRLTPETGGQ